MRIEEVIVPSACIPCRYGVHKECEGDHCDDACPDNKNPWRTAWQQRFAETEADNAALRVDAARLEADLRAAREEAAGLRRALTWYADDGNYEEGPIGSDSSWRPEIDEDRGERARAALAAAETEHGEPEHAIHNWTLGPGPCVTCGAEPAPSSGGD